MSNLRADVIVVGIAFDALASSRSISPSLVTRSTMLGDTNGDFKRKLLGKTEEKVRGYRSVALSHYCGNGYAFCVMISRKLGLEIRCAVTGTTAQWKAGGMILGGPVSAIQAGA